MDAPRALEEGCEGVTRGADTVSHPFNTGCLPLNYSGNPGANGVYHMGGVPPVHAVGCRVRECRQPLLAEALDRVAARCKRGIAWVRHRPPEK